MEENEDESIVAQTEEFQNRQFNSEVSQLFMDKRRRKEDFDLDIVYKNIKKKQKTRTPTHKEVLVERCLYFKKMLNPKSNFIEANESSIYIEFNKDFKIFKIFIDYLYSGIIELQGGNVFDVYYFSQYINQEELVEYSITFLGNNLSCETLPQICAFADSNNISKLTAGVQIYTDNNFNDVISKSTAVLEWPSNVLIQLLSSTKMKVKREEAVLQVVCKWLNIDFDEREQFMQELFQKLRFSFMSTEDINAALQEEEYTGRNSKIPRQCSISMIEFEEKLSGSAQQHLPEEARDYYEGIYSYSGTKDRSQVFELYWPKNKTMTKSLAPPSQERNHPVMASLSDKLYLSGGFVEFGAEEIKFLDVVDMYDPKEHQWSPVASMNIERCGHIHCTCEGKVYAFGGLNTSNEEDPHLQLDSEVYDPSTNQWSILPEHPFNKEMNDMEATVAMWTQCEGAAAAGSSIFLLYCSAEDTARLMEYKPKTNEWSELPCNRTCIHLVGYDSLLFLFTSNLEVVIYDSKSKFFHGTFHGTQVKLNGFSDRTVIDGAVRYHDRIILRVREEMESGSVDRYQHRFAVFNPKVVLQTLEDDMNTQTPKLWPCEKMALTMEYQGDYTVATIY